MRYIPTITGHDFGKLNFDDLTDGDEILFTPSVRYFRRNQIPEGKFDVVIDNGCYLVNTKWHLFKNKVDDKMTNHIALCQEYVKNNRCIFILPDIAFDPERTKFWTEQFLTHVKPKRFVLVDWPVVRDNFGHLMGDAEFLCTKGFLDRTFNDINKYHYLGRVEGHEKGRSFDDVNFDSTISLKQNIIDRSF